jgi:hypothetical protein
MEESMQANWRQVEHTLEVIAGRLGLTPQTPKRQQHPRRRWVLRYASALSGTDNLKIDSI